ncbi:MAG: hypothetical protein ACJAR3_000981 [Roseivirga sp.]|jgi:hypothetical protein
MILIPPPFRKIRSKFSCALFFYWKTTPNPKEIRKIENNAAPLLKKFDCELLSPIKLSSYPQDKSIWLNQKDNSKFLFRSRQVDMHNRQNIEVKIPITTGLKTFILILSKDIRS